MIREERNALILLFTFATAAGLLYFLVLRPALESKGLPRPKASTSSARPAERGIEALVAAQGKEARRMVTVRARVRDAIDARVPDAIVTQVLGVEDIAEPERRDIAAGELLIEYLPPSVSFALRFEAAGYQPRLFERLREEAHQLIDLGVVRLEPVRSLAGTVLDDQRAPAANTLVAAYPLPRPIERLAPAQRAAVLADALLAEPIRSLRTGADGRFQLQDLAARDYVLYVARKGLAPLALPLSLRDGARNEVIRLDPGIRGNVRLRAEDGDDLGDTVGVLIAPGDGVTERVPAVLFRTAADGTAPIGALSPVPYFVFADSPLTAAVGVGAIHPLAGDLLVTLPTSRSIEGRITDANRQIPHAATVIGRSEYPASRRVNGQLDANGRYHVDRLLFGMATIEVLAEACAPERRAVPVASFGGEHDVRLRKEGILRGTLSSDGGSAIANAWIREASRQASAISADDGSYALAGLPVGRVAIECGAEGFLTRGAEAEVRLDGGSPCDLVLRPGGRISVTVKSPSGGDLLAATVIAAAVDPLTRTLRPEPPLCVATSDDRGRATLGGLRQGQPFAVFAFAEGLAPVRSQILDPDEPLPRVGLTLARSCTIEGDVVLADGSAARDAIIQLTLLDGEPLDAALLSLCGDTTFGGADGHFAFRSLPQAAFRLIATSASAGVARAEPVAVSAGNSASCGRLQLQAAAPIHGFVRARGAARLGAQVTLVAADDQGHELFRWQQELTDADGRFAFPPVPAPSVQLLATAGSQRGEAHPDASGAPCILEFDPP